ncbi:uncharacterized protein LOC135960610 [Calliphora vicina]|uniref:uncharacterized protein LOC135960610 n=1 Tax=Calliphora vicina TaxID=7373 RepID=UPI00325ACD60
MNKLIFLILCWTFTTAFAETPSWFPENVVEINNKCAKETQVSYSMLINIRERPNDIHKVQAFLLCKLKGVNAYNEDTGLNVDRFAYIYYRSTSILNSKIPLVQDCVDKNKEAASGGEMIYNVIICLIDQAEGKST